MGNAKQNSETHESLNVPKEKYKDIEEAIQKALDTEASQQKRHNDIQLKSAVKKLSSHNVIQSI